MAQEYMNEKYTRGLIISGLSIHLIYAMQLKYKMYSNQKMDLVIATANQEIYVDKSSLEKLFDRVYFLNMTNVEPPKNKSIKALVNPRYALNQFYIPEMDPDEYSDIFFWGPTWVYYNLFKYSVQHHKDYCWHLYGESDSGYVEPNPAIRLREYGYPKLKKFYKGVDKYFFGYTKKNYKVIKDIYLWNTKYVMYEPVREIVEMPVIDCKDNEFISLINSVYGYTTKDLKNKVVFLDGASMGSRENYYDVSAADSMLAELGKQFGKERFIIKPHHGVDANMYSEEVRKYCTILSDAYQWPWEVALINGVVENCVICGFFTSAITMMYIMGITEIDTYVFRDYVSINIEIPETRYRENEMIDNYNETFHFVNDEKDFLEMIDAVKRKYSLNR